MDRNALTGVQSSTRQRIVEPGPVPTFCVRWSLARLRWDKEFSRQGRYPAPQDIVVIQPPGGWRAEACVDAGSDSDSHPPAEERGRGLQIDHKLKRPPGHTRPSARLTLAVAGLQSRP